MADADTDRGRRWWRLGEGVLDVISGADRTRPAGHGDVEMSGLGALVVGLVLCFVGVKWLPVAVLACGFALGWLLTEPFNATLGSRSW